MGLCERESDSHMPNAKHTEGDTLLNHLEALPGALFFLDGSGTIVYTNTSAQVFAGAKREDFRR